MDAFHFRRLLLMVQDTINRFSFCRGIEGFVQKQYGMNRHGYGQSPVFIVGAPRSGSTLLFQLLLNTYDFSYISNIASLFYSCPAAATLAAHRCQGRRRVHQLKSRYGYVAGLLSPSEAGPLMRRWFGEDNADGPFSETHICQVRKSIGLIGSIMEGHLLLKSLKLSLKIDALSRMFPGSIFIHIKREPIFVAQSILLTRRNLHGDDQLWWSYRLTDHDRLVKLEPLEQIVRQISTIEEIIDQSKQRLIPGRYIEVSYENLCHSTGEVMEGIERICGENGFSLIKKKQIQYDDLKPSKRILVSRGEWERLDGLISEIFP